MVDARRGFRRARRLLRKSQFDEVLRNPSLRTTCGPLRLTARENEVETSRLGLVVGRRMLPRAVDRNRVKRVIRESFRCARDLPTMDIVVRLAVPAANVSAHNADCLFDALADSVQRHRRRGVRRGR